jgi:quinol monooxygenase YgiN
MTVARTWRARVDAGRLDDYLAFLHERSIPMFSALPGCLGAVFLRDRDQVTVVSVWSDGSAIDALTTSSLYNETVAALDASGILRFTEGVAVHHCDGFVSRV